MRQQPRFRKPLFNAFPALRLPLQILALCLALATQGTVDAADASLRPLGIGLGAKVDEVRAHLDAAGARCRASTNADSRNLVLSCRGGFQLAGLQQSQFVFSADGILQGVVLTLPKDRWRDVTAALSERYSTERRVEPFVGSRSAQYRGAGGRVIAEAPHLSFEMTVVYATDWLLEQSAKRAAERESEARRADAAGL